MRFTFKGLLGNPTTTGLANFALDVRYLLTVVEVPNRRSGTNTKRH